MFIIKGIIFDQIRVGEYTAELRLQGDKLKDMFVQSVKLSSSLGCAEKSQMLFLLT